MRFQVKENTNGKYVVLDTYSEKLCAYSGKAANPPKYVGEWNLHYHEWNNYYSAAAFAQMLEWENRAKDK